jgi:hypothetical protein
MDADLYHPAARGVRRPRDDIDALVGVHREETGFGFVWCPRTDGLHESCGSEPGVGQATVQAADTGVWLLCASGVRNVGRYVGRGELDRLSGGVHLPTSVDYFAAGFRPEDCGDVGRCSLPAGIYV